MYYIGIRWYDINSIEIYDYDCRITIPELCGKKAVYITAESVIGNTCA